jgi:hypothetical protein
VAHQASADDEDAVEAHGWEGYQHR